MASPHRHPRLTLTDEEVADLVFSQFPNLAGREIGRRYTLHDHTAVRIGDDYGVLMPTAEDLDPYFERAATLMRDQLPRYHFPYSAPIAQGKPGAHFGHHWNLVEWVSASTAGFVPLHAASMADLGAALAEIHAPAPADAPGNPVADTPLAALDGEWRRLLAAAADEGAPENRELDTARASDLWETAAAAAVDLPRSWTHGNLEPRAVLSDRGTFAGILIWQLFGAGDPACDLGYASNLVPLDARASLFDGYGAVSDATHLRALGWQLIGALRLIDIGDPFLVRTAWERLIELDLVSEA